MKSASFRKLDHRHILRAEQRRGVFDAHEIDPVLEGHTGLVMKESREVGPSHRCQTGSFRDGDRSSRVLGPERKNPVQRRVIPESIPVDTAVVEIVDSLSTKLRMCHGLALGSAFHGGDKHEVKYENPSSLPDACR